jgi:hypothetical protein
MICQLWMKSTILKNMSQSYGIVTHNLGTTFEDENLGSRAFPFNLNLILKILYQFVLFVNTDESDDRLWRKSVVCLCLRTCLGFGHRQSLEIKLPWPTYGGG